MHTSRNLTKVETLANEQYTLRRRRMRRPRATYFPAAATYYCRARLPGELLRAPSFALTESQNSRANHDPAGASV